MLLILLTGMIAGACGYQMENQVLPGNATSLAILPIQNLTDGGELDVRLLGALRHRLLQNPAISLTTPDRGEVVLEIVLTNMRVVRGINVSNTSFSSLSTSLTGKIKLRRNTGKKPLLINESLTVASRLEFDQPLLETPAVRDEAINRLVAGYAEKLESLLYTNF